MITLTRRQSIYQQMAADLIATVLDVSPETFDLHISYG